MEEIDENYVPEDILTEAEEAAMQILREKSRDAYGKEFKMFESWMNSQKIKGIKPHYQNSLMIPIDSTTMEIEIVTFINPHLFWITDVLSKNNETIENIEKNIRKSHIGLKDNDFQVDEMVSVKFDGVLVRATIEDILFDEASKVPVFYCWLVDRGKLIQSDIVFKLPSSIQKIPKQAKQACLNNVCYLKKSLELGAYGGQITNIPTMIPESGIYHYAMTLLENNEKLVFELAEEKDGILFGDVIIHKNRRKFSLFEELCAKDIIMSNGEMFKKIKEGIYTYKKTHLRTIHQLTMNTTPPSKLEVKKAPDERCPYDDVKNFMMKPLENGRRRKAKGAKLSSTTSESSVSEDDQLTIRNNNSQKQLASTARSNSDTESCDGYVSANSLVRNVPNSSDKTIPNRVNGEIVPPLQTQLDSVAPSKNSKMLAFLAKKKQTNIDHVMTDLDSSSEQKVECTAKLAKLLAKRKHSKDSDGESCESVKIMSSSEQKPAQIASKHGKLTANVQHFEYVPEERESNIKKLILLAKKNISKVESPEQNDVLISNDHTSKNSQYSQSKLGTFLSIHRQRKCDMSISSEDSQNMKESHIGQQNNSANNKSDVGLYSEDDKISVSSKTSLLLKTLRTKKETKEKTDCQKTQRMESSTELPSDTEQMDNSKAKHEELLEVLKASRKKRNPNNFDDEGSDISFENAMSSTRSEGLDSSYGEDMSQKVSKELSSNSEEPDKDKSSKDADDEDSSIKFKKSDSKKTKPRVLPQNFIPAGYNINPKAKSAEKKARKSTKMSSTEDDVPSVVPRKLEKKEGSDSKSPAETESDSKNGESDENSKNSLKLANNANMPLYKLNGCDCADCRLTYDDDDWDGPVKFSDTVCKRKMASAAAKVPLIKPGKMLKSAGTENEPIENEIATINFSGMTRLNRLATTKLLVHGEILPTAVQQLSQTCLRKEILDDLRRLEYRETKRIQIYAFPALTRSQHVFMVSDASSGKTMTYLPVLYSFILEKDDRYRLLNKMGGGPIAVILCNSSKKCELVYDYAKRIFGRERQVRLHLETYPGRSNASNVDILITLPTVLNALLASNAVNFKRLCHFVLEDGDAIMEKHYALVDGFLNLADKVLEHRNCPKTIQMVVCAEHWTPKIEQLFKMLKKVPLVCIGNYLEAALYGKMTFALKFLDSACKEMELKKLLSDVYKFEKSVVICTNEQVDEIQMMFVLWGINCTAIQNDMNRDDIIYLEEVWNKTPAGQYSVLICTDYIYSNMLAITSASLLIHYSLPKTWSQFIRRFSCLLENCPTPLNITKRKNKIASVVLIDENCEPHMSKIASYLGKSSLKQQLPQELESFFEMTRVKNEEKKISHKVELCENLKIFGKCDDISCDARHLIEKTVDVCENLPQNGTIKFKIRKIHDVTCYSINILEHYDVKRRKTEYCDRSEEIVEKLAQNKRKAVHTPRLGHVYMYEDENRGRERVKLLKVQDEILADIMLIDKGIDRKVKIDSLFKLSDDLKAIPPQTIDVYLANLVPPMQDLNFSAKAYRKLKFMLDENDLLNATMSAEIHLQLGKNLWLKDVVEEREMYDKSLPTMGYQLTRQIVKSHVAEASEEPLKNLYQLCKNSQIELPEYQVEQKQKKEDTMAEQVSPQWAFLEIAGTNEVTFSCAVSPDEFYVKIKKFSKQLEQLEKEIQKEIKRPKYPEPSKIEVGKCYLAPDSETKEYARAIVKEVTDDGYAFCYFVDHGDEILAPITEIKHITNSLISKLPFQSVQCRLIGVKAIHQEWDSAATDLLYDFGYELNTDPKHIRTLYLRVGSKEDNHIIERQRSYSVLIKGGYGEGKKLLSNLMIDCGLAIPNDEEVEDFNVPEPVEKSDSGEDEYFYKECHGGMEGGQDCQIEPYCEEIDEDKFEIREEDIDFCVYDEDLLLGTLLPPQIANIFKQFKDNLNKNAITESTNNNPPKNNDIKTDSLVPIRALPEVDYYTPTCIWSQTDKHIKLTIKIPDVKEYDVRVISQGRIFQFSTYKDEKKYMLKILLFDKVGKTFQHTAWGLTVKITLTKLEAGVEWPRLSHSTENFRHIHYDLDSLKLDDEKNKRILTFDISDDSSDEEDQTDPMFTHFCSDLDSDYDNEIPNAD